MNSKEYREFLESYNGIYEQRIGVPLKDASDRAAKDQLQKMIPKGEKVHTPKSSLQNASYEPDGEYVEENIATRDINARGGFDPRFDKRPKPTTPTTTTTSRPTTPTTTTTSRPTGPVAQVPNSNSGGLLGRIDTTLRDVAGRVGGEIGEREGRNRTGNLPILGDIGGALGRNKGTQQGQQMYDKAKQTLSGFLKQDYEPDNFDIILEYLVSEGYADTNEAAIAIMANMSEEWKEGIIEGMGLSVGVSKLAGKLLSNPRTSEKEGARNFQKNLADPVGRAVKGAAKTVLGVGDKKNKEMMQKRRPN
jgi:hypothetical protein